jgi:two-component system response regulator DevR
MRNRIRALLVDEHEMMQIGISHALRTYHIDVVDACATTADAVHLAQLYQPDLILMETQLADGSPLDACRRILAGSRDMQVIFLTSVDCNDMRSRCLAAGSHGYLLKNSAAKDLADAIHALVTKPHRGAARELNKTPASAAYLLLSPQERKIPPLVADGKTNKEIAEILRLSDKTVKNYLSNIYLKLQVTCRSQLAAVYARHSR